MNPSRATGLGEPEPTGKRALFQPPQTKVLKAQTESSQPQKADKTKQKRSANGPRRPPRRVRITTELTGRALAIIQDMQSQHRLRTGRALPLWKAVSRAIEYYADSTGEKGT